ncbi:MAG: DUF1697 domain-containing protein [Nocardioidaceae bacterium]
MPSYIALLRAVNVGGRWYKMAALREHLLESGLADVETHIQSGNVRFRSPMRSPARVEQHCERVLAAGAGFDVPVVVLTPPRLRAVHDDALALTPELPSTEGARRYVAFFKDGGAPTGDTAQRIDAWAEPGERARVVDGAVHVWLDHGMHDAPFFRTFKKQLAPGTVRDLKVVAAMVERWVPAG